jgi:hypothetical protein
MERIRQRVANVAWIGDDHPFAVPENDVTRDTDNG